MREYSALLEHVRDKELVREIALLAPLTSHSTFRTGGLADVIAVPKGEAELIALISLLEASGIPRRIVGNGSNLLFSDEGFAGVILPLCGALAAIRREDNLVFAGAGAMLSRVACFARDEGLAGLAFAHGIPGTVGGAVVMNAGAYGGEIATVLHSTRYLDQGGEVRTLPLEGHAFGYRESFFAERPACTILETAFALTPGRREDIAHEMEAYAARRKASQPLHLPSLGSVFKRPPGHFAGRLIEDAGLKGCRIGGAMVSEMHAGFIVNMGGATSTDMLHLIEHIQAQVLRRFGVSLSCEIRVVPSGR